MQSFVQAGMYVRLPRDKKKNNNKKQKLDGYYFATKKSHVSSGIDKSTEWSTIPACPSLMCFFNRGNTEGTNSSKKKKMFDACVCFLCICVRADLVVLGIICRLMACVLGKKIGDRLTTIFSPDVILCG